MKLRTDAFGKVANLNLMCSLLMCCTHREFLWRN